MDLRDQRILVTGGAVRIGRAICLALAERGGTVLVHYSRSGGEAEQLARELGEGGRRAFTVGGRLWDDAGCERLLDAAWAAAGGLDAIVNNAAVFHKHSLLAATEEDFLAAWRVNALAPMLLTRSFARRIQDRAWSPERGAVGRVVNLLDRRVAAVEAGCLPYLLSKRTLADFTRLAALELAPRVAVNAVAPGAVLAPPGEGPDYVRDRAGPVPLQRACTPADVARAVAFLLESDAITGQTLFVDGGQHLLGGLDAPAGRSAGSRP